MKYAARRTPPPKIVPLKVSSFDPKWPPRPLADVACGLRGIGAGNVEKARANAGAYTLRLHPKGESDPLYDEAYNDVFLREYVAERICDPNDVDKPPPWMKDPSVDAMFLTPEALRHLFDELQVLSAQESPTSAPLSDGELIQLATLLAAGTMAALPGPIQQSHRRQLRHVLEDLILAREE